MCAIRNTESYAIWSCPELALFSIRSSFFSNILISEDIPSVSQRRAKSRISHLLSIITDYRFHLLSALLQQVLAHTS